MNRNDIGKWNKITILITNKMSALVLDIKKKQSVGSKLHVQQYRAKNVEQMMFLK